MSTFYKLIRLQEIPTRFDGKNAELPVSKILADIISSFQVSSTEDAISGYALADRLYRTEAGEETINELEVEIVKKCLAQVAMPVWIKHIINENLIQQQPGAEI